MSRRSKWNLRRLLSLVLAVLMIAGVVGGIAALTTHLTAEKEEVDADFKRGGINEKGVQFDTDGSMYSKLFAAQGLEIELDFDSHLKYQIFWYYESTGNFNYCTEVSNTGGAWYAPAGCNARIVITPDWEYIEDDDKEISWYETWGYANDITILVNKSQSVRDLEYTLVNLTDPRFTVHENQATNTIPGGLHLQPAEGVTTYEIQNVKNTNGSLFSAIYVHSYKTVNPEEWGIHVRMQDGTTVYYFSSKETDEQDGFFLTEGDLPTASEPLYVPYGATVYVWAYFGSTGAEETLLGFY